MTYPVVVLHPGRERTLERRHQWIFSKAIKSIDPGVSDGDVVFVADMRRNVLATGHYHNSSLALRILDFTGADIDEAFWHTKLQSARDLRLALGLGTSSDTTAYRLVHGEGDELPGLIVDIYGVVAVVQPHSVGMSRHVQTVARTLMAMLPGLEGVYHKRIEGLSHGGATDQRTAWIAGTSGHRIRISEYGIPFTVDLATGQKTGFFLDQRINRQIVRECAAEKEVLNLFSYTGGFSLHALAGGARHVTSVDSSASAIALLEEHVAAFSATAKHTSVCADVQTFLRDTANSYDLIICDPPAFAKNIQKRHNAVQAYKRLNTEAIRHVNPGGMLFTFSCSQVVDRQLFYDTVVAAAIEAGRPARVLYELRQVPDHPVSIFHPEGSYLKGLALYIEA